MFLTGKPLIELEPAGSYTGNAHLKLKSSFILSDVFVSLAAFCCESKLFRSVLGV